MSAPTPPTNSAAWATNTLYAAGSELGTPTKSAPASGRIDDGFSPETKPAPQEWNWWANTVYQWITYFIAALAYYVTRTITMPIPLNFIQVSGTVGYGSASGKRYLVASSSGFSEFIYSLAGIPSGYTVSDIVLFYNLEGGAGVIGSAYAAALNGGATSGGGGITDSTSSGDQTYSFATSGAFAPLAMDGTKCLEMVLTCGQNTRVYGVAVVMAPT